MVRLRTLAFSILTFLSEVQMGERSNGPSRVWSEGVMTDFLYSFPLAGLFFIKPLHIYDLQQILLIPGLEFRSCLILFFSKATAPILAFPLHCEITGNLLMNIQHFEILMRVHFK